MCYNISQIKVKIKDRSLTNKDVELDYDYKEIKCASRSSENMELHTAGRYRAFSFASMSNNLVPE